MSGIITRLLDGALIVLGALGALHLNVANTERLLGFDGSLVAFAVALALSVFPACGTYRPSRTQSLLNVMSRTILAWLLVQACGYVLLYVLHRAHLVSRLWFLYWTITSGLGLLIARTLALGVLTLFWRIGKRAHRAALQGIGAHTASLTDDSTAAGSVRRAVKRGFDVVCAVSLLVALAPLFAFVAVLVRRDGGAITFGHERIGQHGRKFRCLKFRTMVVNADIVLKELLANDPEARAEWARDFKLKNDVRVTAIGRFLRRTSLDELPQLWNVLRGDMSLVGPRPVVEQELERYGNDVRYYLMAKPGITGLWQVSGRNDIDYAKRVSLDVSYVQRWSLSQDVAILVKTIGVVMRREGAY
ncbi:sugar transferase [Paraburkholderia phenazinium]|uniref:Undecaprenyl-phosphate galactose phosphotransferase, WbaP n=1 Tax=Paraburkholderia phenazinium TaxID=60549 RepID=A0A1G7QBL5_9BURK|nr:sugar transferase [Paraburkholderia phenazinium]SDF95884.1 Undecaprenyl-phosphate galactose phosphotransferase, WbaP [Paraburkholderia phenazinium]